MPKTSINFSKTVIYKICCNDATITDIYIGHTTNLGRRKYEHKSHCNNDKSKSYNLKQYEFIRKNGGWDNWSLIQIEEYPCENVNEARARERYWIEELKATLNSDIPGRTFKEYCQDKKEIIIVKQTEYREQHKEEIAIKKKLYYEENKQKISQYKKQYRKQHKKQISEKAKLYYEENREKVLNKQKQYYEENREKVLNKIKQYHKEHRDEINAIKAEYREKHRDEINAKAKEKIRCDICDCDVPRRHISTHNKTLKHLSKLKLEDGSN